MSAQTWTSNKVAENIAVLEWRPTCRICLKIFPALLGVCVVFHGQTECLQLRYVLSLPTATQRLKILAHFARTRQKLTILNTLGIRFCQPRVCLIQLHAQRNRT